MKKYYKTIVFGLFCCGSFIMQAQEQETSAKKAAFERTKFQENCYLEIGGGTQIFLSEDMHKLSLYERFTPSLALSFGKWFSPYWGTRLQLQGYSLNSFSDNYGNYIADALTGYGKSFGDHDPTTDHVRVNTDGTYRRYTRYANLHLDFQLSLASLIGGYKVERRWDLIPAVGIGYLRSFEYKGVPASDLMSTNFSLTSNWKLSKKIDFNLELETAVFPERFDGRLAGDSYDVQLGGRAAISYKINAGGFKKTNCQSQILLLENEVKAEKSKQTRSLNAPDTVYIEKEVIREAEIVKTKKREAFVVGSVLFRFDKANVERDQEINLVNLVRCLEKFPEARIIITGYADKASGSAAYNLALAKRRAQTVYKLLIEKYGVDQNRLELQAIGSEQAVYERNAWNRLSTFTMVE